MRAPRERERAARRGRRGRRAHAGAPGGRAPRARRALPLVAGARAAQDAQQVPHSPYYSVIKCYPTVRKLYHIYYILVTINLYNIASRCIPHTAGWAEET